MTILGLPLRIATGQPSIVSSVPDTTVWAGSTIQVSFQAQDEAGLPLVVEVVSLPDEATFDHSAGLLEWSPSNPQIGEFVLSATDSNNETVLYSLVIGAKGEVFRGIGGEALADSLRVHYSPTAFLDFESAVDSLLAIVSPDASGLVRGVYSDFGVLLGPGDPSTAMRARGILAEHIWPESKGSGAARQRADLHNIYPALESVQQARGEKPFGEILDSESEMWFWLDIASTEIPGTDITEYSESSTTAWEPREDRKGDIARAMYYFSTTYQMEVDATFILRQLYDLQYWPGGDPPTTGELRRSLAIQRLQGNINPFVLDQSLPSRLYGIIEDVEEVDHPRQGIEIEIYPLPASDYLNVHVISENAGRYSVELFDLVGRGIGHIVNASGPADLSIDVSAIPSGTYWVQVTSGRLSTRSLFIVAR